MNHTTTLHHTNFFHGRFPGWIARLIRTIADAYERHVTLSELANLDSHMLDDIGLTRGDLNSVMFKRAFDARNRFDLRDEGRC